MKRILIGLGSLALLVAIAIPVTSSRVVAQGPADDLWEESVGPFDYERDMTELDRTVFEGVQTVRSDEQSVVSGRLVDAYRAPVPGVTVTLRAYKRYPVKTTTDTNGFFIGAFGGRVRGTPSAGFSGNGDYEAVSSLGRIPVLKVSLQRGRNRFLIRSSVREDARGRISVTVKRGTRKVYPRLVGKVSSSRRTYRVVGRGTYKITVRYSGRDGWRSQTVKRTIKVPR